MIVEEFRIKMKSYVAQRSAWNWPRNTDYILFLEKRMSSVNGWKGTSEHIAGKWTSYASWVHKTTEINAYFLFPLNLLMEWENKSLFPFFYALLFHIFALSNREYWKRWINLWIESKKSLRRKESSKHVLSKNSAKASALSMPMFAIDTNQASKPSSRLWRFYRWVQRIWLRHQMNNDFHYGRVYGTT